MNNLMKFVNENLTLVIVVAISTVLLFGNIGSCNSQKKLYTAVGELKQMTASNAETIKGLKEDNGKLDAANKTLLISIQELKKKSDDTNKVIKDNSKIIKELRETRPAYDAVCQPIVDHMQLEIDKITENFNLTIYDRDTWMQNAYNNEIGWKNEHQVRLNLDNEIKLMAQESAKKDEVIQKMQKAVNASAFKSYIIIGGTAAVVIGAVIIGLIK